MATIQKRQNESNVTSYRVQVRLKGHPPQTATFLRLTDAKKWAQQTETAIREGRHFKTVEAKKHTLREAIVRYQREILPRKKDGENQAHHLVWWQSRLGDYRLFDITPALIIEHRSQLLEGMTHCGQLRSPSTANRYMQSLAHLFTIAQREWEWVSESPLRHIMRLKEPRGRVRFLSDDERARLLAACQESTTSFLYLIVVLALSTGARKMEILGLKGDDVDLTRGLIILHETKNGERRVLPLQGYALRLMTEHSKVRALHSDFVFPNRTHTDPIDIRAGWVAALKAANIEDFRFHDLRHSAASYLAMNGATLAEIAEVLGHKTLSMVKRYAHLSEAHTSAVVKRMNEGIFG